MIYFKEEKMLGSIRRRRRIFDRYGKNLTGGGEEERSDDEGRRSEEE